MGKESARNEAFGGPGIPPRWTHGAKDGVGTAYASSSRLWFTVWNGVVTEVYYPTVDRPQLRDLQTATGLLAAGNTETPLRALISLAVNQHEDGGFSRNFWIDGEPYWRGVQLDEVAFPILHWTRDGWGTVEDSRSTPTPLGIEYLDIPLLPEPGGRIRFTFFWTDAGRWEGKDFEVAVLRS